MPQSKKDLRAKQQKKNVAAGIGDKDGKIASNIKVGYFEINLFVIPSIFSFPNLCRLIKWWPIVPFASSPSGWSRRTNRPRFTWTVSTLARHSKSVSQVSPLAKWGSSTLRTVLTVFWHVLYSTDAYYVLYSTVVQYCLWHCVFSVKLTRFFSFSSKSIFNLDLTMSWLWNK